jgi:hypothetical protein
MVATTTTKNDDWLVTPYAHFLFPHQIDVALDCRWTTTILFTFQHPMDIYWNARCPLYFLV